MLFKLLQYINVLFHVVLGIVDNTGQYPKKHQQYLKNNNNNDIFCRLY